MALQWQETPQKKSTNLQRSSAPFPGSNPWIAVSVGLMGLVVGFGVGKWRGGNFFVTAGTPPVQVAQAPTAPAPQQPPEPTSTNNLPKIDPQKDHIRGDFSKATVAVVEYSDFECPFCQRHHPTMKQIMDTYKDDVVWVYRHFPLSFHPNAQKEAEASECANELGGNNIFWKYTDAIFERTAAGGTGFPLENLAPLAKEFGLDEAKFKSCLDSGKYAKHVLDDMSGGSAAGVNGTPGNIVVNLKTDENRIISGAVPFASFKTAIDVLLGSDARAVAPSGAAKTIKMTAELWKFTPNVVRVKQGEKVTLEVTGVSGTHGLSVTGLGINETIIQGNTVSVNIPTDKVGTFDFRCSVQCGSGHNDMTGQIVVES
ncbi:MAG: thioredoxin domain-containing protein [Patescibacteria group bacterium]|mgnify:CR=1 FL=1